MTDPFTDNREEVREEMITVPKAMIEKLLLYLCNSEEAKERWRKDLGYSISSESTKRN